MPEVDGADNQVAPADTATDAYKNLQRKLEAARQRERKLVEQNLGQTEQSEKLQAIQATQTAILGLLQKSAMVDADEIKAISAATAPTGEQAKDARRDIAAKLYEAETQWDDERLDGARRAWGDGKYAEAAKLVATALGAPAGDFDSAVEAEVAKRLQGRAAVVDTGDSTAASTPAATLTSAAALSEKLQRADGSLDREFWAKNKDAILNNVRSGKLRLAAP